MAACRTQAEVAALREAVLDAWAAGDRLAAIAAGLGVTVSTVTRELRERRQRRDPRAAFRYRCAGSQRAKAAARLLAPPAARPAPKPPSGREVILDAWAAGQEAPEIAAIGGSGTSTYLFDGHPVRVGGTPEHPPVRGHRRLHGRRHRRAPQRDLAPRPRRKGVR